MVNFKNIMSLSLALSVFLSTSQAEAGKRSWQEATDAYFESAYAAGREPQFFDPDETGEESSETYEELGTPSLQGTIPRFLMPGFSEWLNSEDHQRALSDEDRELNMAEKRARWVAQTAYQAEQARLVAQAHATSEVPQPDEQQDFDNQTIYIPFDQNYLEYLNYLHYLEYFDYLYSVWKLHPRSPLWPIMDPGGITEIKTSNVPDIQNQAAHPFNTPGHSSDSDSSRKSSVDLTAHPADGYETDSDRENDNRTQPQKGKRHSSVKLPASKKFVAAYKKLSETFSGGALKKEIMKALRINTAAYALLLDQARYDDPDTIKPTKRIRRKS